ncbi:MAG: hypothetical protein NT106_09940 [Candidatus Sumerlaeota bacterium]|nr:hypothetical protein [Candidatus Sumerlaeota bacterium]
MNMKILIDNASLDDILVWQQPAMEKLRWCLATHQLTVYFAPETIYEVFALGATRREAALPRIASLILTLLNGRILNYYFARVIDEISGISTSPFMRSSNAKELVHKLKFLASGNKPDNREWFDHGAAMIREEKKKDQAWRDIFQSAYRSYHSDRKGCHDSRLTMEQFCALRKPQQLVLLHIEDLCKLAEVPDPKRRAAELYETGMQHCPTLRAYVALRLARIWWYTESTAEGRKVGFDHFDDALLIYMTDLDWLITPDRALQEFFRIYLPHKQVMGPNDLLSRLDPVRNNWGQTL